MKQSAADEAVTTACTEAPRPLPSLSRGHAEHMSDLFKVLGDPTRVLILKALIEAAELCVHELAEVVAMSPSAVSHHLRILRHFDLIRYRRDGREVFYRPHDEHVAQLILVCSEHVLHGKGMIVEASGHE